jgi:hypothetical protein
MKKLDAFLKHLQDRKLVRKFEADIINYENKVLFATTEYLNASTDLITYKF